MNTAKWDQLWDEVVIKKQLLEKEMELEGIKYIKYILLNEFETIEGINTIELGSGLGKASLGLSLHGTNATLVDNSMPALEKAVKLFNLFGKEPKILNADLLKLDNDTYDKVKNKFDICMSFGLAEHFYGDDRKKIIDLHFETLRSGGICIISVPNSYCPAYQIWMKTLKLLGKWDIGLEIPFTVRELKTISEGNDIAECNIWTTSFSNSINQFLLKPFTKKIGFSSIYRFVHFPEIRMGFLDRFGYALVVIAKKR